MMKKNLLLYIFFSGILALHGLPTMAQKVVEVTYEDEDDQAVSKTDSVAFQRHGQSERYTWRPSSATTNNPQGKAIELSRIKSIRRYVEPIVYDVTNPTESDIHILSLEKDGTMTIEAPEEKAPRVGDIICSGSTEEAPFGYMLRITEVEKLAAAASQTRSSRTNWKMWKFVIKTSGAVLNELVSNFSYSKHISLDKIKIDKMTNNEGDELEVIEEKTNEWTFKMPLKLGDHLTITPKFTIKPKDLVIHVDVKDKEFKKFGANFDFDMDTELTIDAKLDSKFEKTISLGHLFVKPIPVSSTPPIMITPLIQLYLTFKADGELKLSCIPVNESYEIKTGAYYDFDQKEIIPCIDQTSADGTSAKKDFYSVKNKEDEQGNTAERSVAGCEGGLSFNGSVTASLGASVSFGIDGCNYVGRVDFITEKLDVLADMLSVDFWIDLNRKMTANIGFDNIDLDPWDEFHLDDKCDIDNYVQAHTQFFLRVWNPFKGKFSGFEPELSLDPWPFWEDDLYPSLFVSDFKNISSIIRDSQVIMHVAKYQPYFPNSLFKESGYGFSYGKYKDEYTPITDWKNVEATNIISNEGSPLSFYDGVIPLSDLEKDCKYYVCPYIYGMDPTGALTYIHRKGIYFRVNSQGKLSFNELPNIPGVDL